MSKFGIAISIVPKDIIFVNQKSPADDKLPEQLLLMMNNGKERNHY